MPVAAATPAPVAAAPAAQPVGSASVAPAAPAPVYTPAASAPVTLPTDLNEAKKKVEMLKWAADRLASEGSPRAGEMAAKLNQARAPRLASTPTPNLPTKIIPTKTRGLKISGEFPVDMRIPPLNIKIKMPNQARSPRLASATS